MYKLHIRILGEILVRIHVRYVRYQAFFKKRHIMDMLYKKIMKIYGLIF